jgi:hypothetical protein
LEDIKIKYDKTGIIVPTIIMYVFSYIFYTVLAKEGINGFEDLLSVIACLCMMLAWYSWIELFLIPFILGKPAIILSKDGLFVHSIGVIIPWSDIRKVEIKETRNNHLIKIFSLNDIEKTDKINSLSRIFWYWSSGFFHNTPFVFSTMFIQGKANDIYYLIRSRCRNLDPILSASHRNLLAKQNRK